MSDEIKVKHEYTDLTVNEISLVDRPANQKEFVVIKCLTTEDKEMGEESIEKKDSEKTKDEGVEKVSIEVPETDDEAKQAIKNIEQLVDGISKKLNEQKEPEKEEVKKKDETVRDFFLQSLKKNGAKEEEIEKVLKEFDEKFEKKEEVKKEDEKEQEDKTIKDVDTSKVLDVLSDLVQKGKTFTPKRQETLKNTIEKLNQLLQELAPSSSQTPSDSKFGDSGVKKDKEENEVSKSVEKISSSVGEGFKKIAEVVKSLNERIEKIENARPASKSIGDDQTDSKVKKNNNIWKGLPLT